jgi:hypothetical protein
MSMSGILVVLIPIAAFVGVIWCLARFFRWNNRRERWKLSAAFAATLFALLSVVGIAAGTIYAVYGLHVIEPDREELEEAFGFTAPDSATGYEAWYEPAWLDPSYHVSFQLARTDLDQFIDETGGLFRPLRGAFLSVAQSDVRDDWGASIERALEGDPRGCYCSVVIALDKPQTAQVFGWAVDQG